MSAGEIPATIIENEKGQGALPPERFSSYGDVSTYCNAMISADRKRAGWRAEVDGLINGNRPINQLALKAKNMGWFPNVNWRTGEGQIASELAVYYDLATECFPIIDIDLDYGTGQETEEWAESIEKNFSWLLLTRWRNDWNYHLFMQLRERAVHGLGAHVWPSPGNNWIPRTPKTGHILFPEDSPFNFDQDGEGFMLRDYAPLHALYGFIRNEAAATKLGWDVEKTWKAMALTSKAARSPNRSGNDIEAFQANMKRGDLGYSTARQSGMWLNWCYVRELDTRKASLYLVPEGLDVGGYLFKKRNCFDSWPLSLFPMELGQGTLHSIRGTGAKNKDYHMVKNRVNNTMLAQVILASTILLQQQGTVDPDKLKLLKLGMMSILPQNLAIAQGVKFPDLSQGPLALIQHLDASQNTNNEAFSGGTPDPKDRETAQSFTMRAQDASQITKGAHGLYCGNLRHLYTRMLRMLIKASKEADRGDSTPDYVKLAKELMARCRKDKVPAEAFDHIVEIREVTSSGAGSPGARLNSFYSLFQSPVYANTSEDRKVNIERAFTSALFPSSKVDQFARSLNDNELPDSDDSFATLESDSLARGDNAQVAPRQNHVKHIGNHLAKAQEILTKLQQGEISPEEALAGIQAIGQHVGAHLQQLQGNKVRQAEYDNLRKEWLALSAIADKLHQQVQESQAAAQQPSPQERISDGLQVGLAKVQADSQIKGAKLQSDNALKFRKQAFTERLQRAKTAAEIARANAKHHQLALTNGR